MTGGPDVDPNPKAGEKKRKVNHSWGPDFRRPLSAGRAAAAFASVSKVNRMEKEGSGKGTLDGEICDPPLRRTHFLIPLSPFTIHSLPCVILATPAERQVFFCRPPSSLFASKDARHDDECSLR